MAVDNKPDSPRLMLDKESGEMLDRTPGEDHPAVLFHHGGGGVKGTSTALKGTEGGRNLRDF